MSEAAQAPTSLQGLMLAAINARNAGQKSKAFELACLAATHADASHRQFLFLSQIMDGLEIVKFYPLAKDALAAALDSDGIEYGKLSAMWGASVLLDPALESLRKKPDIKDWAAISTALSDDFLLSGLRKMLVTKVAIEKLFTELRRFLLLEAWPAKILKIKDIAFLSAMAEQCFYNEYIWDVGADELDAVKTLPSDDPIAVCLIGCYEPLYRHAIKPKLSAVAGYRQMMTAQVENPRREHELIQAIKSLHMTGSDVSKDVRAMYEENPYPRWISFDSYYHVAEDLEGAMLCAGCGTGWALTQFSKLCPNLNITALDLTKASLGYAMRMAEKFGADNIGFMQGDIMALDEMSQTFDYIECSGVLHHLADPQGGWDKLVHRLNAGGIMMICLYNTRVREAITAVRAEAKKFEANPEGIRALRAHIKSLSEDHPLKPVSTRRDFYSMSNIRDLMFHVQEATYTLPEIKMMMDALDLEFIGFRNPPLAQHAEERDLEKWHALELQNPDRFYGMYEFLCKRKGEALNETAQKIIDDVLRVK